MIPLKSSDWLFPAGAATSTGERIYPKVMAQGETSFPIEKP